MEDSSRGQASFSTQANALMRKNLTFQKRKMKGNLCLIIFPIFICIILAVLQNIIDNELNKPEKRCGCKCVDTDGDGKCEDVCGIQYSTLDQVFTCPIPNPPQWPALMQVPRPEFRAVKIGLSAPSNLPDMSCRKKGDCPSTVLFTGRNRTFATSVTHNFFTDTPVMNLSNFPSSNRSDIVGALANLTLGTDEPSELVNFIEPAFASERPIYDIRSRCNYTSIMRVDIPLLDNRPSINLDCVQGLNVWLQSWKDINDELFRGCWQANDDRSINEYMAAYDFLDSGTEKFNMRIWYNSTFRNEIGYGPPSTIRIIRSVNLVSNAYLQLLKGSTTKMSLEFLSEMPKPATQLLLDISSLIGAGLLTWIVALPFPVILTYLVYEKQHNIRIMMKMHGLGDGPYWIISYAYFLLLYIIYILLLVVFGSLIGLKYFTLNDYSIQFVFYFAFINQQIALAFLLATFFTKVKTAQVITYIYIFGSALLGDSLLIYLVEDTSFPRVRVTAMEIVPGFALYRGLYDFGQYAFTGRYMGTFGMSWKDLSDDTNGMREVLIIIVVEWIVILPLAFYLDRFSVVGRRIMKNLLPFARYFRKKVQTSFRRESLQRQGSKVFVEVDKPDVAQERTMVEQLLLEPSSDHAIISDNLKKVYPGRDGNPDKLAVQGLSVVVRRGECFGFLGPNGAGKTSFINMMIGLISPTSGNAYVHGNDIQTDMDKIYTSMGVCPQHNMLWEMLTGREHLLFYGRLKNLKGSALLEAVDESLKSVNLYHGGAGDKKARKYSGGMKRRLSVAISLIGNPKVVYMDEPSTGLDPASRNSLWNVMKNAKKNRAIILTTHSMEEAEVLCDRIGIFVKGGLECIGNPKQLKARYGGTYILTMTTSQSEEQEVEEMVRKLSRNANRIYHISGTQKFEIPKQDIKIAQVFEAVEKAKTRFPIQAWGLADTTLEDVFIKVADGNDSFNT